jgi:hypothetical protein
MLAQQGSVVVQGQRLYDMDCRSSKIICPDCGVYAPLRASSCNNNNSCNNISASIQQVLYSKGWRPWSASLLGTGSSRENLIKRKTKGTESAINQRGVRRAQLTQRLWFPGIGGVVNLRRHAEI